MQTACGIVNSANVGDSSDPRIRFYEVAGLPFRPTCYFLWVVMPSRDGVNHYNAALYFFRRNEANYSLSNSVHLMVSLGDVLPLTIPVGGAILDPTPDSRFQVDGTGQVFDGSWHIRVGTDPSWRADGFAFAIFAKGLGNTDPHPDFWDDVEICWMATDSDGIVTNFRDQTGFESPLQVTESNPQLNSVFLFLSTYGGFNLSLGMHAAGEHASLAFGCRLTNLRGRHTENRFLHSVRYDAQPVAFSPVFQGHYVHEETKSTLFLTSSAGQPLEGGSHSRILFQNCLGKVTTASAPGSSGVQTIATPDILPTALVAMTIRASNDSLIMLPSPSLGFADGDHVTGQTLRIRSSSGNFPGTAIKHDGNLLQFHNTTTGDLEAAITACEFKPGEVELTWDISQSQSNQRFSVFVLGTPAPKPPTEGRPDYYYRHFLGQAV